MKRALVILGFLVGCVWASPVAAQPDPQNITIHQFFLPGTQTSGWRVHGGSTEISLRLAQGDVWAEGGYKVAYAFAHNDYVGIGASDALVPIAGSTWFRQAGTIGVGVPYQLTPYGGSIIGIAISASAALTAGDAHAEAIVFDPSSAGTTATGLTAYIGAEQTAPRRQYRVDTQAKDVDRFVSGNAVGCRMNTGTALAPNTVEIVCTVIVEY